ncbi:MAG: sigma-70 family RNA polymerase sigma factor [Deltaproteobacteria bacterium]|nr:sigma-70 family RNA polymerase sigma factor [Deltaproteobacteria bacterium]
MADGSPKTPPPAEHRTAFVALYRQHTGMVRRALRQLGVPGAHLDDAVQDVFVVLHRRIDDFQRERSLKNWLWGIARGVASGYRRSAFRRERLHAALPAPSGPDPLDWGVARQQANDVLDQFLGSLDADKCAVFVLSEIEGRRGPEIAALLDVNLNTVYARLRAARKRFDEAMANHHTSASRPLFAAWLPWSWPVWSKPVMAVGAVAALVIVPPHDPAPPASMYDAALVAAHVDPRSPVVTPAVPKPRGAATTVAVAAEPTSVIDDDDLLILDEPPVAPPVVRLRARASRSTAEAKATPSVSETAALEVFEPLDVEGPPVRAPWASEVVGRPTVRHPTLLSLRQDFLHELLRISAEI